MVFPEKSGSPDKGNRAYYTKKCDFRIKIIAVLVPFSGIRGGLGQCYSLTEWLTMRQNGGSPELGFEAGYKEFLSHHPGGTPHRYAQFKPYEILSHHHGGTRCD